MSGRTGRSQLEVEETMWAELVHPAGASVRTGCVCVSSVTPNNQDVTKKPLQFSSSPTLSPSAASSLFHCCSSLLPLLSCTWRYSSLLTLLSPAHMTSIPHPSLFFLFWFHFLSFFSPLPVQFNLLFLFFPLAPLGFTRKVFFLFFFFSVCWFFLSLFYKKKRSLKCETSFNYKSV